MAYLKSPEYKVKIQKKFEDYENDTVEVFPYQKLDGLTDDSEFLEFK